MKKGLITIACMAAFCIMSFQGTASAIAGIGVHYGIDLSLSMPDKIGDQVPFENMLLSTASGFTGLGNAPGFPTTFLPTDIPIYIDRSNWTRSPLNIGGKVYVDVIPFLDCIELSGNFGVWEYDGAIRYPNSIDVTDPTAADLTSLIDMQAQDLVTIGYDTMDLTLKGNEMSFLGLTKTPYAKLQTDLNIRKYIKIPVIHKVIKTYAGAGFNVHFATPALSAGLVEDAIGDAFPAGQAIGLTSTNGLVDVLSKPESQKKILEEITSRLLTPHYGVNILAGVMIKPPIVPLGLYVDGKFMIPFGPYDKDADITGTGFLINAGVALAF